MSALLADLRALARGRMALLAVPFALGSVLLASGVDAWLRRADGAAPDLASALPAMVLSMVTLQGLARALCLARARREAGWPGSGGAPLLAALLLLGGLATATWTLASALDGGPSAGLAVGWGTTLVLVGAFALWPLPAAVLGIVAAITLALGMARVGMLRDPHASGAVLAMLVIVLLFALAGSWLAWRRSVRASSARTGAPSLAELALADGHAPPGVTPPHPCWLQRRLRWSAAPMPRSTSSPQRRLGVLLGPPFGPASVRSWATLGALGAACLLAIDLVLRQGLGLQAGFVPWLLLVLPVALVPAGWMIRRLQEAFGGRGHVLAELALLPGLGDARARTARLERLLWWAPLRLSGSASIAVATLAVAIGHGADTAAGVLAGGLALVLAGGLYARGWRRRPGGRHELAGIGLVSAHMLVAQAWAALLAGATGWPGGTGVLAWLLAGALLAGVALQWQAFATVRRTPATI